MGKRIKVLECIRQGLIGGGESHLLVLMENIDLSKYEPVVLSFTDGPMIGKLNELNVKNYIIKTTKPFDITIRKSVKKLLIREGIELVHAHGTRANSNILWAARSLKIPVIYTVHGWSFHPDQHLLIRRLRIWGEKYLTSKTQLNISVSVSNQQSGQKYIREFKSVVVNNGIDRKRFDPRGSYKDIRRELGIPADTILVLFLARFTSHKQPLALIEAFSAAVARNSRLHLLMVGDGDQKMAAVKRIEALGLQDKITLQTFRQDVPDLLAASDIYVLPSLWEGLPIGLLEAMAMGKAVIGTRVDGTSEVIEDNCNGLLVETGHLIKELEEKIILLAGDPSLREKLQQNAMAAISERFNGVNMTRQIEALYNRLLPDITN